MEALPPQHPKHHIFISYSGHQKGFAIDLSKRLSSLSYAVFCDQEHHSLPPGQPFPPLIFSAANTCKLAIVVLSHDFLSSRWPMIELCAFANRLLSSSSSSSSQSETVTLLPLFFKLSPEDLKNEANLELWRKAWEGFEQKDGRIKAAKCEETVTKLLPRLNGIVRRPESKQGEASYLDQVVDAISAILPTPGGFTDPYKEYVARDRLCKVILDKFQELEERQTCSSSVGACILGMHGIPGTGKSTLCRYLCDSMFEQFSGNVVYLELPTESDSSADKLSLVKDQCSKFLSKFNPYVKDIASMDLNMVLHLLNHARSIQKSLVVLDNITATNYESYTTIIQALLSSAVLGPGSKILLVAQSTAILDGLRLAIGRKGCFSKYTCGIMEVPCLTEEEATKVIMNQCPSMKQELATHLLHKISFQTSSSMYIPFVFEQIGVLFRERHCGDVEELELLLKMVDANKKKVVHDLLDMNFKRLLADLQLLFFDIALFILPAGYSKLNDAIPILSQMHGISDAFTLRWKIMDLEKHCALSVVYDRLTVHDIFTEYASNVPGNSATYSFHPSLDIDAARKHYGEVVNLKCSEARTINIDMRIESPHHHWLVPCDEEEVRLHVEVGATAQALLVRNYREYSKCILHLSGDLSSLVCLLTENVEEVAFSPCGNDSNLSNLFRLELKNEAFAQCIRMKTCSRFLDIMSYQVQRTTQSMRRLLKSLMFPGDYDTRQVQHVRSFVSSGWMRWLRVVIIYDVAGVQSLLQKVCQYCPELEILEVHNNENEPLDVRIDKAPKLKKLSVKGTRRGFHDVRFSSIRVARKWRKLALNVRECPELREMSVDDSFDQVKVDGLLPSKLRHLAVADDRYRKFLSWKLVSSSALQLSQLQTLRLSYIKVKRLQFTPEHLGGCLPSLEELHLERCTGLTHVSMDPGCLPNLVRLEVWLCGELQILEGVPGLVRLKVSDCFELQALEGVEDMSMKWLNLSSLPKLQLQCDVMRSLENIYVWKCPHVKIGVTSVNGDDMKTLVEKKQYKQSDDMTVNGTLREGESKAWVAPLDRWTFSECRFTRLTDVDICRLYDLREIEGIQHLSKLRNLFVRQMWNLTRVSGAWPASIGFVDFDHCPMLTEIPRFEHTPGLYSVKFQKCVRLKSVQGCFSQMERPGTVIVVFIECKAMEAFPMDEQPLLMNAWRRQIKYEIDPRNVFHYVTVCGSGFVSVGVLEAWLRDAEVGSLLFDAALEALIWEHACKGTLGALEALQEHCFALISIAKEEELLLFKRFFLSMLDSMRGIMKMPPEMRRFSKWVVYEFPQLLIQHSHIH